MGGTFNLSFVFWIWLISVFILGLKIKSVSGFSFERKPEPGHLKIPALGRTSYGIGSLYDGRTGNFLPPEFSVLSTKARLNSNVTSRKIFPGNGNFHRHTLTKPSDKLSIIFESPKSVLYDTEIGVVYDKNYGGLALRAVLGMLEFPENGTGGFLLDNVTQEELAEINTTFYIHSFSHSCEDEFIFPGKKPNPQNFLNGFEEEDEWSSSWKNPNPQGFERNAKILRREIRRNMKKADIKILKKATHVVVKVIRGSQAIRKLTNSTTPSPLPARIFNDTNLSPLSPEGVPLSFELMPLLQFLNKSGLELTPSSHQKFLGLENSIWRNPMDIFHGQTFRNLDWSWQLILQMTKLNTTLNGCLEENPRKDKTKARKMIQDLQNRYENITEKSTTYKRELKNLLEKSSSGTEQDEKLWDSIYEKEWRAVGTGVHWNFYRVLERIQKKVFLLGGENNKDIYSESKYHQIINAKKNGVKIGCDAIPEIL